MPPLASLLVYLAVGTCGGVVGAKSRIPAGVLIGAVMAVMLFKLVAGKSWETPKLYNFFAQVILGVLVALTYTPGMFHGLGKIMFAIVSSTVVLTLVGLLLSYVFFKMHIMDMDSAYLATNPGAMSVLVPLGVDMNVNTALIAQFHFFRILFIAITSPFLLKIFMRWL